MSLRDICADIGCEQHGRHSRHFPADQKEEPPIVDDQWEPTQDETRRAYTCDGCGRYKSPAAMIERPCPTGDCTQVVCPDCGHEWASWGPVLCKSCGDLNWLWRQHHRASMWIFDRIEMPIRAWLRKRKGKR